MEMVKNVHQSRDQRPIDMDHQENNLEEVLEPASDCCIYRIPQFLRHVSEEAYTPKLISIGPLHYDSKELMGMEKQKKRYLTKFGERVSEQKLGELETYIKNQEARIRDHYAVSSKLQSSKYVSMILLDAVFIIELFVRNFENVTEDFLLVKSQLRTYITLDLLLLENQLPYFVLNDLYSSVFPSTSSNNPSFSALCLEFFSPMEMFNWLLPERQVQHFTDLLRHIVVVGVEPTTESNIVELSDLQCATKLDESGLKFKGIKGKSLLDIKLVKRGRRKWLKWLEVSELQIPRIEIYDETEALLRNLMALELFHYPKQTYVCNYADLMDYLINTAQDVDLLVEKGIIGNCVGDHEAIARMFNRLCSRITPSDSCFHKTAKEMIAHYTNPWNHAKATLKRAYFSNYWTGTATVAATFILILTLIQSICSILQVVQGNTEDNVKYLLIVA